MYWQSGQTGLRKGQHVMKLVEAAERQITDPAVILSGMREILKTVDPEYPAEEERYQAAAAALEQAVDKSLKPSVKEYLAAEEAVLAGELLYIGWQGFRLNMDIFSDPVRAVMLEADDEELHRERRLGTLTEPAGAREIIRMFHNAARMFPQEQLDLLDSITGFYAYLRTVGYKLVHYFGFRLAGRVLPYLIPGYTGDPVTDSRYMERLRRTLGMDPKCLG